MFHSPLFAIQAPPSAPGGRRSARAGLRERMGILFLLAFFAGSGGVFAAPSQDEDPEAVRPTGKPWIDMDYGPYFTAAVEVSKGNIACKGLVIRLDEGPGGVSRGREFFLFDTDTLRAAGAWRGEGPIDWRSIVFDGSHGTHPRATGTVVFETPPGPGWADGGGRFDDVRIVGRDGRHYGPLPRSWAHWRGLYLHGRNVILSYTVGATQVLELPQAEGPKDARCVTRTLEVGPRAREIVLEAAYRPGLRGVTSELAAGRRRIPAALFLPENARPEERTALLRFEGGHRLEVEGGADFEVRDKDFTILARIRTREGGTIFAKAPAEGPWKPDGVTFFVRGGRLCYDIGWVGVVASKSRVADGEWHDVAAVYTAREGMVRLYIDGRLEGERELRPRRRRQGFRVRIGFTSPDFPEPSAFDGEIEELRFYSRALAAEEVRLASSPAEDPALVARWRGGAVQGGVLRDITGRGHDARAVAAGGPNRPNVGLAVALLSGPGHWKVEGGHARLHIPEGAEPAALKIAYAAVEDAETLEEIAAVLASLPAPRPLTPLTKGGPARWRETVRTEPGRLGGKDGPFEVDVITTPDENPYRSWMRLGGFDFLDGGRRAAVCTWQGDVWIVGGLGGEFRGFTWRRIATGLYQPLGLKVRDGEIYVLGRDQITRLHDLNGDGEADWYENFNNDAQATEHFHEFAMDLQTDAEGNFYYMKGGRHALDAVVPQHGTLLKVARDGSRTEILAWGFRAPDGLYVQEDGTFLSSDQEGHWIPENKVNWVVPGRFYGYMWSYHPGEPPKDFEPPLCWIDHDIDRSPSAPLRVESAAWGPLAGKILCLSYGTGKILYVPYEEVEGRRQGAVVAMPIPIFPTGIHRGRFHPKDDGLYVAGLFGWSSNRTAPGGFFRVRPTGKPLHLPLEFHATTEGVFLRFSDPLDARRAARAGSYRVTRWNYKWLPRYGTDDWRVSDGARGREAVKVRGVKVAEDGRRIFLFLEDMRPSMQLKIEYRLRSAGGARVADAIFLTVHALGEAAPYLEGF